jgi:hypothetical protein
LNKPNQGGSGKKTLDERRIASEKHDAQFFKDRKVTEAKNLELTLKLRAQRLAHEATLPKPDKPTPRAPRKKAPRG